MRDGRLVDGLHQLVQLGPLLLDLLEVLRHLGVHAARLLLLARLLARLALVLRVELDEQLHLVRVRVRARVRARARVRVRVRVRVRLGSGIGLGLG